MAIIKPFKGLRPKVQFVKQVAALPYDVMDRQEAKAILAENPLSFLSVSKAEAQLPDQIDAYSPLVYEKAQENFENYQKNGILLIDDRECFYIYKQKMGSHEQVGIVAAASVEEYRSGKIKKHELTRPDKEDDRVSHIKATAAQSGAVFLTYRASQKVNSIVSNIMLQTQPVYDFIAEDGIAHTFYIVVKPDEVEAIRQAFSEIDSLYIADGHHRSAAAMRVADICARNNKQHTGKEEYNYFLSVIFPDNMMQILDYNRVVTDLNGHSQEEFLQKLEAAFAVERLAVLSKPKKAKSFVMYLQGSWYALTAREESFAGADLVGKLDVSILQNNLLAPVLGIADPRTDKRINFVGGIRGLQELQRLVDSGKFAVAFALYPTSMQELIEIADTGAMMPPKSTWFEPKLRDAMAIHLIEHEYCK